MFSIPNERLVFAFEVANRIKETAQEGGLDCTKKERISKRFEQHVNYLARHRILPAMSLGVTHLSFALCRKLISTSKRPDIAVPMRSRGNSCVCKKNKDKFNVSLLLITMASNLIAIASNLEVCLSYVTSMSPVSKI